MTLMFIDFRFNTLDPMRNQINWLLRPLEYVTLTPRLIYDWTSNYFTTRGELERAYKLRYLLCQDRLRDH